MTLWSGYPAVLLMKCVLSVPEVVVVTCGCGFLLDASVLLA